MQPYRPMASPSKIDSLLQSTNYGSYAIEVKYQVDDLLNRVKDSFQPSLEEQFYSGMKMNLIVLNGSISAFVGGVQCQFPAKILLPAGFPSLPPKVFIQPDSQSKLVSTSYLQGSEVNLTAVMKWAFNPQYRQYNTTLYHVIYYLSLKFNTEPPLTRNVAPSHPGMYTPSQALGGHQPEMMSSMYVNSSQGYQNQRAGGYQPQPMSLVSQGPPMVGGMAGKSEKEILIERIHEKIKKMSKSLEQEATNYMKNLAEVKMRLEMNRDSLKLAKEQLTNECTSLQNEIKSVVSKNESTEIYLTDHKKVEIGEDNIDSLVFPKDEVNRRMLKQICKEQAIDDTLSVLTKAVANESISHDDYLTAVRNVTMKQFYCVLKRMHLYPALQQKQQMMI